MKKPSVARHAVAPQKPDKEKYSPAVMITPVMRFLAKFKGESDYLIIGQEYKMTAQALIYNPAKEATPCFAVFTTDAYIENVHKKNGFYYRTFRSLEEMTDEWEIVESLGQFWSKPRTENKGAKSIDQQIAEDNSKTMIEWMAELKTIWDTRLNEYYQSIGEL